CHRTGDQRRDSRPELDWLLSLRPCGLQRAPARERGFCHPGIARRHGCGSVGVRTVEGRARAAPRRSGSHGGTGRLRRRATGFGSGLDSVARKAFITVCVSGVQTCITGGSAVVTRRVPATVLIGTIAVL